MSNLPIRLRLINRLAEAQRIRAMLTDKSKKLTMLFLEGDGGIGKTMLLEKACDLARRQADVLPPVLVDFYDTSVHSQQGLESAIAKGLDPKGAAFAEYWPARRQNPQADLWEKFVADYNKLTEGKRALLCFDTTERLETERDSIEVFEGCALQELDTPAWKFLLERLAQFANTAVVIAARPTAGGVLRAGLESKYGKEVVHILEGFKPEETLAYLKTALRTGRKGSLPSGEMVGKIQLLTRGRPILIALAAEWLKRGLWDPSIHPVSLKELSQIKAEADQEAESGRQESAWRKWYGPDGIESGFTQNLVRQFLRLNSGPTEKLIRYASLCRRGCNVELLCHLMDESTPQERESLPQSVEALLNYAFIKRPREGDPRHFFFLHDEMYDLLDVHYWRQEWPSYSEPARIDRRIISWYDGQVGDLESKKLLCQDFDEKVQLRRQQQLLVAERLYYQFDEDPRLGYQIYARQTEEAISVRELEWDTWLRNEALWFTAHRAWRTGWPERADAPEYPGYPKNEPAWEKFEDGRTIAVRSPAVDYDCRRRWVNRYIARSDRGGLEKAIDVARELLGRQYVQGEPELYRSGLRIALATAEAYRGGDLLAQALDNFALGIKELKNVPKIHRAPWLYTFLLAMAHLYQAYAFSSVLLLDEAVAASRSAIRQFATLSSEGYPVEAHLAEAQNNLAYYYARLGKLGMAEFLCEEALVSRQRSADEYGIGLSLNTKGVIYERMNRPSAAIKSSERALDLFRETGNERGIVMAEINLGRSYRRRGRGAEWGQEEKDFERGKTYLEDAIQRLKAQGAHNAETLQYVEAHSELGCLHRDWANTNMEKGMVSDRTGAHLDIAENNLESALQASQYRGEATERTKIGPNLYYIDCLEDLSRVYYLRALISSNGKASLQTARVLLDRGEQIARAEGTPKKRSEIRLAIGKIYFTRARISVRSEDPPQEIASNYARAAGYVESHSTEVPELQKFVGEAVRWLCTQSTAVAESSLQIMRDTLAGEGLRGARLRECINEAGSSLSGIIWPDVNRR